MKLDIPKLMSELAQRRPIFHSEADFQHELAWLIHLMNPDVQIRLEHTLALGKGKHLDIYLRDGDDVHAIELKYKTKARHAPKNILWNGERFSLKNQSAENLGRYDFCKDVQRLERVVLEHGGANAGYAVMLTNNPAYWKQPDAARSKPADAEFRIHDGAELSGERNWGPRAGPGTTKDHEGPIILQGKYHLTWSGYHSFGDTPNDTFRYLIVEVTRDALASLNLRATPDALATTPPPNHANARLA